MFSSCHPDSCAPRLAHRQLFGLAVGLSLGMSFSDPPALVSCGRSETGESHEQATSGKRGAQSTVRSYLVPRPTEAPEGSRLGDHRLWAKDGYLRLVQAAIGLVQFRKLERLVLRRRDLAERYRCLLSSIPGLRMIDDPSYGTTNYQSFWILLPDESPVSRDETLKSLARAEISARRGIMAAHLEPAYADQPHAPLPVTERLTACSLILPLFHDMTEAQQDVVVSAVRASLVEQYLPSSPVRHASAKGMPKDYTQDNSVRIGDVECPAP